MLFEEYTKKVSAGLKKRRELEAAAAEVKRKADAVNRGRPFELGGEMPRPELIVPVTESVRKPVKRRADRGRMAGFMAEPKWPARPSFPKRAGTPKRISKLPRLPMQKDSARSG